jgi:hypothetical protein
MGSKGVKNHCHHHPAILADGWGVVSPHALPYTCQRRAGTSVPGDVAVLSNQCVQRLSHLESYPLSPLKLRHCDFEAVADKAHVQTII